MPSIRIQGQDASFPCDLTTSILNVLMRNGFPIATLCGGRAACGRDLIRIREGLQFTSPRRPNEIHRLAALAKGGEPLGNDFRLACQTYVRGDVVIEVMNLRGPGDTGGGPA